MMVCVFGFFFFQAEDGIRDAQESRGLGDVYKRQLVGFVAAVQEVDHDHVVLLAVPMAAADALLDPLGLSLIHI